MTQLGNEIIFSFFRSRGPCDEATGRRDTCRVKGPALGEILELFSKWMEIGEQQLH